MINTNYTMTMLIDREKLYKLLLIKKIKNRIYLFDMIYNELNKEREYKSLCNVVDKNYGNYNLEKKELEIFKDALMKVGYGNMRYKYSFNNLENIISYLN